MFEKLFRKGKTPTKDEIAKILNASPEALSQFEEQYRAAELKETPPDAPFVSPSVHSAAADTEDIINRIVSELLSETKGIRVKNGKAEPLSFTALSESAAPVTMEEISSLPEPDRPQLTGSLMKRDISEYCAPMLVKFLLDYRKGKDPKERTLDYHMFRQGLDIQDLDPLMYAMLGANPTSMSHWLPALCRANSGRDFFKIPDTTVIRVPLTLLQLSRLGYETLTHTTLEIADRYCRTAFDLKDDGDYFLKTGVFSNKFDFRNCRIRGEEIRDAGQYLLYISSAAVEMASPLNQPSMYGAATTNEWVVREFISDPESDLTIYHGLPLRTEYRVFIDTDTDRVIGIAPYWDPETMRHRFGNCSDKNDPDMVHDYITYSANEEKLMKRFHDNADTVRSRVEEILPALDLKGQWSLDVMQSGEDFYLIDMAPIGVSALRQYVPKELVHEADNWIPDLSKTERRQK